MTLELVDDSQPLLKPEYSVSVKFLLGGNLLEQLIINIMKSVSMMTVCMVRVLYDVSMYVNVYSCEITLYVRIDLTLTLAKRLLHITSLSKDPHMVAKETRLLNYWQEGIQILAMYVRSTTTYYYLCTTEHPYTVASTQQASEELSLSSC